MKEQAPMTSLDYMTNSKKPKMPTKDSDSKTAKSYDRGEGPCFNTGKYKGIGKK
jgi:hypothetical protein